MADITVTIPNSTFTIDTISNGIQVTTPTSVEVNVDSNAQTIDIVNTPQQISVLTNGIVSFTGITSVNGNTGPVVVLDTDDINEGITNQYFTTTRARTSITANDTGGDGSLSYSSSTGVITYTGPSASEVRAHFSAGTGISIVAGLISVTGIEPLITLTTSTTTADQVLDSFLITDYRTAKYVVSVSSGTEYHSFEILVNHNGTTANQTTYADLPTGSSLATFTVDISAGLVRLLTSPTNAVTVYKVTRTAIAV